jgi:ankyrin repeat protein
MLLLHAIESRIENVTSVLIKQGANVNTEDNEGMMLLSYAMIMLELTTTKLLLNNGTK